MAQLDQGGFSVQQERSGSWETVGYVYVEEQDLLHVTEHWILIDDKGTSSTEEEWKRPDASDSESDIKVVKESDAAHDYANVGEYLSERYDVSTGGRRIYIRCECAKMVF